MEFKPCYKGRDKNITWGLFLASPASQVTVAGRINQDGERYAAPQFFGA